MSKRVFFLLLVLFSLQSFGQTGQYNFSETTAWLQKSKRQKTAAWLLLSGGTLMVASGYILFIYEGLKGEGVKSLKAKLDVVLLFGGIAAMVSSIALFSQSTRSRKIAMTATAGIKMENSFALMPQSVIKKTFPALVIKINL